MCLLYVLGSFVEDPLCTVPDRIAKLLTVMKLNSRMGDALPYGAMTSNNGSQCHTSKHREASTPRFDTYVLAMETGERWSEVGWG